MSYTPKLNDYVKWNKGKFSVEGWIYFMDSDYLTIEIGTKDKHCDDVEHCPIHSKYHTLVVCYPESWNQLTYVKSRECVYDEKQRNYGKNRLNLIKKYLFKYKVVFYTVLNKYYIIENQ